MTRIVRLNDASLPGKLSEKEQEAFLQIAEIVEKVQHRELPFDQGYFAVKQIFIPSDE